MPLKKQPFFLCALLQILAITAPATCTSSTENNLKLIGLKVWKNECAGTIAGLTSWNAGEEFASLGIGHFIWYPENYNGPYEEQFPQLVTFLKDRQVPLPAWLGKTKHCPWKSRADFLKDLESTELHELRSLLYNTIDLQIEFMKNRLEKTLPKLIANRPPRQQQQIANTFHKILNSNNGLYALLDYVNFKGEGTSPKERYRNQGWGLLQVLERMPLESQNPLKDFVASAKEILSLRVENAPIERNEKRWLAGWHNRLDSYLQ